MAATFTAQKAHAYLTGGAGDLLKPYEIARAKRWEKRHQAYLATLRIARATRSA